MLDALFDQILRSSVLGAAAIVLVLLLRGAIGRRLAASMRCVMWLPVAMLLVAPQLPDLGLRQPAKPVMMKRVTTRASAAGGMPVMEQTLTPIMNVRTEVPGMSHQTPPHTASLPAGRTVKKGG